jgi:hypothetical protein
MNTAFLAAAVFGAILAVINRGNVWTAGLCGALPDDAVTVQGHPRPADSAGIPVPADVITIQATEGDLFWAVIARLLCVLSISGSRESIGALALADGAAHWSHQGLDSTLQN